MQDMAMAPSIATTCPYCGVGCGILATLTADGGLSIVGDPNHPANRGRLCVKGAALGETMGTAGRLLTPRIGEKEATWNDALELVARKFSETIREHGPDSVAFYVSGQLLTEDYYVANKLMKGFIGSANIDTNSRLCMASSVAGHRRAFGSDTVPGQYEDLELADVVVLVGSNLAWCHPVLYQRLAAAKAARPDMRVIVIDPRRTATCDIADLHLPIAGDGDVALFNLLLSEISRRGAIDRKFVRNVTGLDEAISAAKSSLPSETGLSQDQLAQFLDMWIGAERVVTVYSQGVNQSASGTDKVNAIINCHLATGRIGRPGMGPLSVTGQPNAMGGREVGGLANMLACHLELENSAHRDAVGTFWRAPRMATGPGLKAVDMFDAVADGRIKAIWIMCTNPVVSMPNSERVSAALRACDFVVVSDMMASTDTTRLADVLLPATGWGEKDGTVTNSERMISRQRRTQAATGQARHDWQIICDVAARMGWPEAFAWSSPAEIFAEHAALSGVAGALGSDFDISDYASATADAYDNLSPFVWPATQRRKGGRFFGDGKFHFSDGKARMLPVCSPVAECRAGEFTLNTGRVRDHWHTMTRTGTSPRLSRHMAEPYLEIHPQDASRLGLAPASLVHVSNDLGTAILRVMITDRVPQGHPFAPIHWSGQTAPTGRVASLVPAVTDPISGQPASKSSRVALRPFRPVWYGYAVSHADLTPQCEYWAKATLKNGIQLEMAGLTQPRDWALFAKRLFGVGTEPIVMEDRARGTRRFAILQDGRLTAALYIARDPVPLARSHVISLLGGEQSAAILAGQPSGDRPDPGATICACFGVGVNTIIHAIAARNLCTVEDIGAALGAGTRCGSCRPELRNLLRANILSQQAAE
ncbi:MAG: nitrate reductase [Paracoccus denitrificans]|nr:MAG: nitrate reductase [Paracoccus denitrificans]PZO83065.1 MAG: nitrate reductase [Paracoccus denitrificans]